MKKSIYVLLILIIVIGMLSGCDSVTKEKGTKVGQYITFGTYEQDNDLNNGKEDIEWRVLEVKDNKRYLIVDIRNQLDLMGRLKNLGASSN